MSNGRFRGIDSPYVIDLESNLTETRNDATGTLTNGNYTRTTDAVFACDLTWPGVFSANGLIMELGATGIGAGIGIVNSGADLRVCAGDGGGTTSSTDRAVASIATSSLTVSESGTLVWEFRVNPGRVRMWWNGLLLAEADTTGGGALDTNTWAGADGGHYIGSSSSDPPTALTNASFAGTSDSNLRYYENQLVTSNAGGSGMWDIQDIYEGLTT